AQPGTAQPSDTWQPRPGHPGEFGRPGAEQPGDGWQPGPGQPGQPGGGLSGPGQPGFGQLPPGAADHGQVGGMSSGPGGEPGQSIPTQSGPGGGLQPGFPQSPGVPPFRPGPDAAPGGEQMSFQAGGSWRAPGRPAWGVGCLNGADLGKCRRLGLRPPITSLPSGADISGGPSRELWIAVLRAASGPQNPA